MARDYSRADTKQYANAADEDSRCAEAATFLPTDSRTPKFDLALRALGLGRRLETRRSLFRSFGKICAARMIRFPRGFRL